MTIQNTNLYRPYELSVPDLDQYWKAMLETYPHLKRELNFFIDVLSMFDGSWDVLTTLPKRPGRLPKSRPSQFFFYFTYSTFQMIRYLGSFPLLIIEMTF